MSARHIYDSSEFQLDALESRSLLSGAPMPNPGDATLLNGQHPVADKTFLDPNEDWTVAQPGYGSGVPFVMPGQPGGSADTDTEDYSWADRWDMPTQEELDQIDDLTGADFSGITGLPAGATQHLYPDDEPAPWMNAPMLPALEPAEPVAPVVPQVVTPAPAALIPLDFAQPPKATFIDQNNVFASEQDASGSPLFVFGASRPSLFAAKAGKFTFINDSDKPDVIASFVGTDGFGTPTSADLTLPSLQ
jgi:hypothetical protein